LTGLFAISIFLIDASRVWTAAPTTVTVNDLLKEAQDLRSRYQAATFDIDSRPEIERILKSQLSAGEIDDALNTSRRYADSLNNSFSSEIAEALARRGRRKEADEWMRKAEHGYCCDDPIALRKSLDDRIRVSYLEYQISSGDLAGAVKTGHEVTTSWERPIALRKLAAGHARVGDQSTSKRLFRNAVAAALAIPVKKPAAADSLYADEWAQAKALWEICDEQIAAHDLDGASETLRTLVTLAETIHHGLSRMESLYEAARHSAVLGDHKAAKQLFIEAVASRGAVKPPIPCAEANKEHQLGLIAKAQAAIGEFDEATQTARMIESDNSRALEAFRDISIALAKTGDMTRAIEAAMAIEPTHESWARDEALVGIVRLQIEKRDLRGASTTAGKIGDPVNRAVARLNVASQFALLGDRETAMGIVAQIRLTEQSWLIDRPKISFDFQRPRTWGVIYDKEPAGGLSGYFQSIRRTARLAGAAANLAHRLQEHYPDSFAVSLADSYPEVVLAVAREQTALGATQDALLWTRQVGTPRSNGKKVSELHRFGVKLRTAALLGVAEGILQREGKLQPPENE
jgi:hypothetical protein